ncbi:TIGR03545 family protein [Aestuariibacter sp. GS-14]|uniref:TIGR03545 family protein n=1 Tax=Aestuariibacter sp. GS-14 TaxID=2590670 RepID=UPI001125EDA6|nr:TIGR03545 family protein [Aestuariibacter sp. GS-14]TPV55064.1 TIGR03545 family protein [Aestuariibacter sp. GS-14]
MQSKAGKLATWTLAILLVPVVLYWLFADSLIKSVLESQLTQSYGAEVNIGQFEHHLFPLSVSIDSIELTNPAKPDRNQVVVGQLKGDVEFWPLLSNQLIMNELAVTNVAFDQPRKRPGMVLKQPDGQSFEALLAEAKEALPGVDELLARSPLKTTAAVEQAQQTYNTYADGLKQDYEALPDKAKLEQYKAQVKALKETNLKDPAAILQAKQTLEQLKESIKQDKALISAFTDKASEAKSAMSDSLQALKSAPQEDYELLKGIYAGDQAALSQLTAAVFGPKAAEYNQYLFAAFDIIVPLLKGEPAAEEAEEVTDPMQVLIRQANVSVNWQDTLLSGDWKNITNVHSIFGNPTTFLLNAANQSKQQFRTEGEFFLDENGLDAKQSWQIAGLLLDSIPLTENKRLDASIKKALLASAGALTITDNQLSGSGSVDLSELILAAAGSDKVTNAVASALGDLHDLGINLDISGSLTAPKFALASDLDTRLASAALASLDKEKQAQLAKLQNRLQQMVATQSSALSTELGDLSGLLSNTQQDSATLDELLKTTLNNAVEKQKEKLLNKLFNKGDGR